MARASRADAAAKAKGRAPSTASRGPMLAVAELDVYYGRAHALQGVSFAIERGVTAIVGRNGMGKTTLCNAITGLVRATGSVHLGGEEILGMAPHEVTRRGMAYVPQGRRVWPSLTVDETLRLVATHRREVERVYSMFPRLAERKGHGGAQLSGGEQQMLAIARALMLNPRLLLLDEPLEGLAPLIVQELLHALTRIVRDEGLSAIIVEQNPARVLAMTDDAVILERGSVVHAAESARLATDTATLDRYLAVGGRAH